MVPASAKVLLKSAIALGRICIQCLRSTILMVLLRISLRMQFSSWADCPTDTALFLLSLHRCLPCMHFDPECFVYAVYLVSLRHWSWAGASASPHMAGTMMNSFPVVILHMIAHSEIPTCCVASSWCSVTDFTVLLLWDLVQLVQDLGLTCGSYGLALLIDRRLYTLVYPLQVMVTGVDVPLYSCATLLD